VTAGYRLTSGRMTLVRSSAELKAYYSIDVAEQAVL